MRVDTVVPSAAPAAVASASVNESTAREGGAAVDAEGIRVTLSELGRARSAQAQKNGDIDDSDLPATIKQLLKVIRELKAQLAEKMAELQALMAQQEMDAETRQMQAQALQTEVASLSGALSSASAQLVKAMSDQNLGSEQGLTVASLLMG
ncbi:hypothetical protein [Phytopseudomonas dryadis]|uniref:Chemotaxis protein n=1 Tax=Phytopseudomonas dryadis TaxID=2487520 RepID=A0A4Q9R3X8_9GAMM|nr:MULTISPECIES: hypothetical protein [Pseudomonas]TBU93342.1 hypothetical protein DNK44_10145 [Pseudomonas dryadis]TBV07150.1 hypothetical protein DNK34_10040 [Pseudomonas dryadis]TBV19456.1 hypothetical protein DNK41_02675 [Pseudomonas sp. FRB 230]